MQNVRAQYDSCGESATPLSEAKEALHDAEVSLRLQLARVAYLERNLIAARDFRDSLIDEYELALRRHGRLKGGAAQ